MNMQKCRNERGKKAHFFCSYRGAPFFRFRKKYPFFYRCTERFGVEKKRSAGTSTTNKNVVMYQQGYITFGGGGGLIHININININLYRYCYRRPCPADIYPSTFFFSFGVLFCFFKIPTPGNDRNVILCFFLFQTTITKRKKERKKKLFFIFRSYRIILFVATLSRYLCLS